MDPAALGWWTLGALIAAAIVVAVVGVFRVRGPASRLNERIDGFSELPMLRAFEATSTRLEATQARLAEAQALTDRVRAANERVAASLVALAVVFAAVGAPYRQAATNLRALAGAFVRQPRSSRSPES